MTDIEMVRFLKENGYEQIIKINQKWCALHRFAFTVGLVVGIDKFGYERRYCFDKWSDALESLQIWLGFGHPSGNWIKCKGTFEGERVDIANPNYVED